MGSNYYTYQYHFIDDFEGIFPISKNLLSHYNGPKLVKSVEAKLLDAGWEGDGTLRLIWLPPFLSATLNNSYYGVYVWHVKQSNNGTSWLASRVPLDFDELLKQQW